MGDVKLLQSEQEFEDVLKTDKLVVVDAFAEWCGPCRLLSPKIEEYSQKYKDVVFTKFDIEKVKSLSDKLDISAMPTLNFFKNGENVGHVLGFDPQGVERVIQETSPAEHVQDCSFLSILRCQVEQSPPGKLNHWSS